MTTTINGDMKMLYKKGESKGPIYIALVLLGLLVAQQFGYIGTPQTKAIEGGQVTVKLEGPASGGVASNIALRDNSAVSFYMKNKYLPTSLLTDHFARVFVTPAGETSETDKGLIAHGGSLTLAPFDTVRIYFGENSTTYYTEEFKTTLKDSGAIPLSAGLVGADTGLTFSKFDEDEAVSTFTTNFTLGTAATTYYVKVKAGSDLGWSNPTVTKGPAMCLEYNTTAWKSPSLTVETDPDKYAKMTIVGLPSSITTVAAMSYLCWEGKIEGDGSATKYKLDLESNVNVDESTGNQIRFITEDVDIDIDADDTTKIIGYVDEDGNDLGQVDQSVILAFA